MGLFKKYIPLLFVVSIGGCAAETVRVLQSVQPGMTIQQVRQRAGQENDSKIINGRTYHEFGLFEDQTSKYFGMRRHYIVVTEQGKVVEWGSYSNYFVPHQPPWTHKKEEP